MSLAKPVIFYCNDPGRKTFYRDAHPLTRLIDFESGVAVGAMITDSPEQVAELLARTFENRCTTSLSSDQKNQVIFG
jgi:hypothetical protein